MATRRLVLDIDEELAKAVESAAAESHQPTSEVIERVLRSHFGLHNVARRIWSRLGDEGLDEDEADALAVAEVKAVRAGKPDDD